MPGEGGSHPINYFYGLLRSFSSSFSLPIKRSNSSCYRVTKLALLPPPPAPTLPCYRVRDIARRRVHQLSAFSFLFVVLSTIIDLLCPLPTTLTNALRTAQTTTACQLARKSFLIILFFKLEKKYTSSCNSAVCERVASEWKVFWSTKKVFVIETQQSVALFFCLKQTENKKADPHVRGIRELQNQLSFNGVPVNIFQRCNTAPIIHKPSEPSILHIWFAHLPYFSALLPSSSLRLSRRSSSPCASPSPPDLSPYSPLNKSWYVPPFFIHSARSQLLYLCCVCCLHNKWTNRSFLPNGRHQYTPESALILRPSRTCREIQILWAHRAWNRVNQTAVAIHPRHCKWNARACVPRVRQE